MTAAKPEAYALTGQTTGRPTVYDPRYCEMVIEWGKAGKSRTWMAANIGVVRQTLGEWAERYPDFSHALTLAKQLEQAHWEDLGHENMRVPQGYSFSQSAWSRSMAARFPEDWRESTKQEVTGPDGGPVKQEIAHVGLDEFASRIARIAARTAEGEGDSSADAGTA